MSKKGRKHSDWQRRNEDRQVSLDLKSDRIKRFKSRKTPNAKNNEKKHSYADFGKYENVIDKNWRQRIIDSEYLLYDDLTGCSAVRPESTYRDIASILYRARENKGIYVILCWPTGIEWPHFLQIILNNSITKETNYEDGVKVALYPATARSVGRGRHIRICRTNLVDEAKKAYDEDKLNSRHHVYFALNDFEKDDSGNARQHPSVTDSTPIFECDEVGEWKLVGGGYFKDVYTYMFNFTRDSRRPVIEKVSSALNNPNMTLEGIFLLPSHLSARKAVQLSSSPTKVNLLLIDGREKTLDNLGGSREVIQKLVDNWIEGDSGNSMVVLLDSPKIYQTSVYQVIQAFKRLGIEKDLKNSFFRYSFLRKKLSMFDSLAPVKISDEKQTDRPLLEIIGLSNYHQMAKLYKIANKIEVQDRSLCRNMHRAIGFIDRISSLPVSQSELLSWLQELTENWSEADATSIKKKYLWKSYKRNWLRNNGASSLVTSIDEFLGICDQIESRSSRVNEIAELVLTQLIEAQEDKGEKSLILVKERRIAEFVKDLVDDVTRDGDNFNVEVGVYSSSIEPDKYNQILILGLKQKDFRDIVFFIPKAVAFTKVYISAQTAFKFEREIDILCELPSFQDVHPLLLALKEQLKPVLDSIRHLGVPSEYSFPDSYGDSYDFNYEYSSFANIYLSNKQVIDIGKETTIIKYSNNRFRATSIEEIEEGDWIVPMDGLIEELEQRTGKGLSVYKNEDEDLLKSYFKLAKQSISNNFNFKTRTERAEKILSAMKGIDVEACRSLHAGMVIRWVKHIEEYEECGGALVAGSAKNKVSYLLFANSLKIPNKLAEVFWDQGIKANRVAHIQEGRGVSSRIKHVLVGTMSGNELGLDDDDIEKLTELAKERLCRIEMISLCEKENAE